MANILVDVEKGIEVGAEYLLKWFGVASKAVTSNGPGAIVALGALLGAAEKAIADVEAGATNPASLVITLEADIADFKAVWPAVKEFAATLGIKV